MTDMVFQGTVLGPCLWNSFFGNIGCSVVEGRQEAQVFADDLKYTSTFPTETSEHIVFNEFKDIQARAHQWGHHHRVTFDPSKESFHIIHPLFDDESVFRLLGTMIDSALTMKPLIDALLAKTRPKSRAILRMKHLYDLNSLFEQFKMHVWSHFEYHNGAIIMAKNADRERIDRMQRGFLYQLGSNDTSAFVDFNFAPPSLRRAIAMLGFIHKRVQGTCHPALVKDLPFVSDRSYTFHSKTLESHFNQVRAYRGLYNTSLWSYVLIYNRLPQGLIEQETVKSFQSKLTHIAKVRAQGNDPT